MDNKREIYIDYIRVFATIAVIMIHIACTFEGCANTLSEKFYLAVNAASRCSVPLFTMISGKLLLSKTIEIKKIYTKYLPRIIVSLVFYSFVYTRLPVYLLPSYATDEFKIYKLIFSGHHLWYLYLCIGLYIFLPVIKLVVDNKKVLNYFLILSIIFFFIIPELLNIAMIICPSNISKDIGAILIKTENLRIDKALGYVTYFMLGYTLDKYNTNKKQNIIIYALGIIGVITTYSLEILELRKVAYVDDKTYFNYVTLNVLLVSIAMFTLFKNVKYKSTKLNKIIITLQKYTFGIYLIHLFAINIGNAFGMYKISQIYAPIHMILSTLIVFVVSLIYTLIIKTIPFINKYIT